MSSKRKLWATSYPGIPMTPHRSIEGLIREWWDTRGWTYTEHDVAVSPTG